MKYTFQLQILLLALWWLKQGVFFKNCFQLWKWNNTDCLYLLSLNGYSRFPSISSHAFISCYALKACCIFPLKRFYMLQKLFHITQKSPCLPPTKLWFNFYITSLYKLMPSLSCISLWNHFNVRKRKKEITTELISSAQF